MALVTTAVLLFDTGIGSTADPQKHDRLWYDSYFFNPGYGQASYWTTQTDSQRILTGLVFDWLPSGGTLPDFSNRQATAEWVIRAFEENRGVNFDAFDVVVTLLAIAKPVQLNGGSTGARSNRRGHNAVVMRVGDAFDFVAHELGHAIGLQHSFGTIPIPVEGDNPGGYGHPFCIMSAHFYGGSAAAYAPPKPRDDAPEYSGLGPSLNGLTARADGWIDAHLMDLGQTVPADFTIRARQWLGRTQSAIPQGLEILSPDGSNYVLDFYVPEGWDRAQPGPAVVLTQGRNGRAQLSNPLYAATNSGTYLTHARLPVTFGAIGAMLNGPGFRVQLLDYNATAREVRVRVLQGTGPIPDVTLDSRVDTLDTHEVEEGVTTWTEGEALCLTGTWPYKKVARSQQAVIDVTYELGAPGMVARWAIDGVEVAPTAAPLSGILAPTVAVSVAHPKFQADHQTRVISLEYDIQPLPNGSRLKLRNRPVDETFQVTVEATLSNNVGSGSVIAWVDFKGLEYAYDQEFYRQRDACFQRFIDVGKRFRPYKVVLDPHIWEQIDPFRQSEVSRWLDALADLRERGEVQLYEQGSQALAREIGVADLGLRVLSVEEAYSPPRIQHEIAPPAPPASEVIAPRGGRHSTEGRLAGYLLAGAAGAALAVILTRCRS